MSKALAIIPARGGSKTVPRKNLRSLAGKPLIAWSIDAAHMAQRIDRVVVSTDDPEIKKTAILYGAEVIDRPAELATDESLTDPVMIHALKVLGAKGYKPDYTVLLQPTSPIRPVGLIDDCIMRLVFAADASSLFTGFYGPHFVWYRAKGWAGDPLKRQGYMRPMNFSIDSRKRRQDMSAQDVPFFENGSVYVTRTEELISTGCRVCEPVEAYEMPITFSLDINTQEEFDEAENILAPNYYAVTPRAAHV